MRPSTTTATVVAAVLLVACTADPSPSPSAGGSPTAAAPGPGTAPAAARPTSPRPTAAGGRSPSAPGTDHGPATPGDPSTNDPPPNDSTTRDGVGVPRAPLDCVSLAPVHQALLGAAGLGGRLDSRDDASGCWVLGQRGVVRVVDAGPVDPAGYLLATGFAAVETPAGGDVTTAVAGGVAAAAARAAGTTIVVRLEGAVEGRDADQAREVLRLVAAHAGR